MGRWEIGEKSLEIYAQIPLSEADIDSLIVLASKWRSPHISKSSQGEDYFVIDWITTLKFYLKGKPNTPAWHVSHADAESGEEGKDFVVHKGRIYLIWALKELKKIKELYPHLFSSAK